MDYEISLENFHETDGTIPPNTPRSLQVLEKLSIDPQTLVERPFDSFKKPGLDIGQQAIAYQKYEEKRQNLLARALEEYNVDGDEHLNLAPPHFHSLHDRGGSLPQEIPRQKIIGLQRRLEKKVKDVQKYEASLQKLEIKDLTYELRKQEMYDQMLDFVEEKRKINSNLQMRAQMNRDELSQQREESRLSKLSYSERVKIAERNREEELLRKAYALQHQEINRQEMIEQMLAENQDKLEDHLHKMREKEELRLSRLQEQRAILGRRNMETEEKAMIAKDMEFEAYQQKKQAWLEKQWKAEDHLSEVRADQDYKTCLKIQQDAERIANARLARDQKEAERRAKEMHCDGEERASKVQEKVQEKAAKLRDMQRQKLEKISRNRDIEREKMEAKRQEIIAKHQEMERRLEDRKHSAHEDIQRRKEESQWRTEMRMMENEMKKTMHLEKKSELLAKIKSQMEKIPSSRERHRQAHQQADTIGRKMEKIESQLEQKLIHLLKTNATLQVDPREFVRHFMENEGLHVNDEHGPRVDEFESTVDPMNQSHGGEEWFASQDSSSLGLSRDFTDARSKTGFSDSQDSYQLSPAHGFKSWDSDPASEPLSMESRSEEKTPTSNKQPKTRHQSKKETPKKDRNSPRANHHQELTRTPKSDKTSSQSQASTPKSTKAKTIQEQPSIISSKKASDHEREPEIQTLKGQSRQKQKDSANHQASIHERHTGSNHQAHVSTPNRQSQNQQGEDVFRVAPGYPPLQVDHQEMSDYLQYREQSHSRTLLQIISQETQRELERKQMMDGITDPMEKKRLGKIFDMERVRANAQILECTRMHEEEIESLKKLQGPK
eukprot:TRINITY_DN6671_c0_g1_i5.p1 TRINITY_DN6671_c0_g1~~TRINITY_DN6671_c0_g1_i5.p1  ORF type:complete len:836 (+),score=195.13 TRINITY_DN6671_c0_g1_i5:109-2616(+)